MKVAFDPQIFTLQEYGGISRYFVKLLGELHKKNVDAKIFAGFHRNKYLNDLPRQVVQGVGLSNYPPRTARLFQNFNQFVCGRAVEKYGPGILHETYYSSINLPRSSAARFLTVYDMIHEKFPDNFLVNDKTTQDKLAAVKRADHIICISRSTKHDLCEIFDVDPGKVSVVYLGFDELTKLPVNTRPSPDKPYFLYVGQRKGYKNFALLLKALSSVKVLAENVDILAFGGGAFDPEEQELIRKLQFEEGQVRQVTGDDHLLAETYAQALGFVYPSVYEGFGLPPLEAMAYKCPVISSNTSSMPEVIGDAGLYFDPNAVDDLAAQLTRVFDSKDLRQNLIDLGTERKEIFTWSRCASETLALYEKHVTVGLNS